jgi:hypothetical protein
MKACAARDVKHRGVITVAFADDLNEPCRFRGVVLFQRTLIKGVV